MPTLIQITRTLSIDPLVTITDPAFQEQYSMGVWWALYGDEQGTGKYDDKYLVEGVASIARRRSNATHIGFYLGMIHGGWLVSQREAAVTGELVKTF